MEFGHQSSKQGSSLSKYTVAKIADGDHFEHGISANGSQLRLHVRRST